MSLLDKKAETSVPLFPILQNRWSPRAFLDLQVEDIKIQKMLEAMRWGPSAGNSQPWRLIYGKKGDSNWQKILDGLEIGNQIWCKDAPILIIIVGKVKKEDGKPIGYAMYDCGGAAAQITFQANSDGLFVHQMAGVVASKIMENFNIPENYKVFTSLAIGYLGNPDGLKEDLSEREKAPRVRLSIEDIVFQEGTDFWK